MQWPPTWQRLPRGAKPPKPLPTGVTGPRQPHRARPMGSPVFEAFRDSRAAYRGVSGSSAHPRMLTSKSSSNGTPWMKASSSSGPAPPPCPQYRAQSSRRVTSPESTNALALSPGSAISSRASFIDAHSQDNQSTDYLATLTWEKDEYARISPGTVGADRTASGRFITRVL